MYAKIQVIPNVKCSTLKDVALITIKRASLIHADGYPSYNALKSDYEVKSKKYESYSSKIS